MAANKRLVYFLAFLVIVLPVITGILVWKLLPQCDEGAENGSAGKVQQPTTTPLADGKSTANPGSASKTTTVDPHGDGPWHNLRLPSSVRPVHYELSLFPDFYDDESTFYGNVSIEIRVTEETRVLMVHVLYLNISSTRVVDAFSRNVAIKRTFEYHPNQFWVIETVTAIPANSSVQLQIAFSGSLKRSIVGFYKSTYMNDITKKSSSIATTKFEPVNARRAFPCMDEPNIKAEYTVTLIHRRGYTALSNMPVQVRNIQVNSDLTFELEYSSSSHWSEDSSLEATRFLRSVKMSTYLACFIVCDFKYLEGITNSNVKVRLYAPPDRVNQTRYALEVALTAVDLYTDMFDISYPLPKLDLISIPDFVSGAMENWGLITFRETNILFDPRQASAANKQRVATVVAHEVSHQWFGNLVTMDWWQDLWLNEGFASFMEYLGADKHEPDWNMPAQFLLEDEQPVMETDAGVSSHPIVVHVTDPADINAVFDSISYSKGSSVIRMLEQWMGRKQFFGGISRYLNTYKYRNAQTDDLWEALGQIQGSSKNHSVKAVMDTWTKQMGLPVLIVTVSTDGRTITLTQSRFLADKTATFDPNDSEFRDIIGQPTGVFVAQSQLLGEVQH
ncbi:AMPE-like protein [Mya arenaria]|uniref:glutamyl aminopeptidase n=1 Tax=Mya arenaria TaxID=6604 RepID=A0ABY7DIX7_MYAAR|nr:AMPE-like protein [Mya arenaria]